MKTVHIEFISDFICPWCYLGKARLERVKATIADEIRLDIDLKPYILYPHIPKGGLPKSDFATKTKPGMGKSLRMEAEKEGIHFNYKYIERIPNSLEAHRLVALVKNNTLKYELAKKIFYGYFEEGQNIEDSVYLLQQAQIAGVSKETCLQFSESNLGAEAVQLAILQSKKEEFINIVPSMKLDHKFLISGLQSAEVLEKYIRRAAHLQFKE
ncbi:MAG: DsbA family protein [Chitinophagales bacterium]